MSDFLFGWIREIPGLTKDERNAYKAFHVFVIISYFFWVRQAVYPFVGGAALMVDRGVKAIFICSFLWFAVSAFNANVLGKYWNGIFSARAKWTLAFTVYALVLGFYYNLEWAGAWSIISVGIYFATMVLVMAMGRGGDYFRCNWKLFLFFFYLTALLMVATSSVELIKFDVGTGLEREFDEERGTSTLSYQFRGVMQFALFFLPLVCLWRNRVGIVYRILLLATLFPYAYFQIYVQKFRSHIILLALTAALTMFYSLMAGKIKAVAIVLILAMIGFGAYNSKSMIDARERVEKATEGAIETGDSKNKIVAAFLGERGGEFEAFWRSFPTHKKIFGGGAMGYFDAYGWNDADHWCTCHIGFVKIVLIGGVFFLLFYLGFFLKAFTRRMTVWERMEGLVPACKILIAIIFLKNWVNPIIIGDACFEHFIVWLALGALWSPPSRMLTPRY